VQKILPHLSVANAIGYGEFFLFLTCIIFRAIGTGPINKTTPWSRSGYNGWIGANIHSPANKYIIIGPPKWSTTALSRSLRSPTPALDRFNPADAAGIAK
jgi:hypothetical protein